MIFRDDHDRKSFLERLRSATDIFGVRVHAYVLMSNHFHLIVETSKANLSEFMRQFNISYTGYYNRRHRRIGHLYQGRFKSIVVDKDSYLLALSRYVHLNPRVTSDFDNLTILGRALRASPHGARCPRLGGR